MPNRENPCDAVGCRTQPGGSTNSTRRVVSDETEAAEAAAVDESVASTSHGAGGDETEVVAPLTQPAPDLAWSHDEPETEVMAQPWRSAWGVAAVVFACLVVIAVVVAAVGYALVHTGHASSQASAPSTYAAPIQTPAPAAAPTPADPYGYVALAVSPRALTSHAARHGGTAVTDTPEHAHQIALTECRDATGNDDCVLVNDGMYHGCVGIAVAADGRWAGATGVDADSARAEATRKLGLPVWHGWEQCSNPPGVLGAGDVPSSPAAAAPLPPPPPSTVTVQAAPPPAPTAAPPPRDADRIFREGVAGIPDMHIVNWDVAEAGARSICGGFAKGMTRAQVVDEVQRNDPTFLPWQTSGMVNVALAAYCPQYEGD